MAQNEPKYFWISESGAVNGVELWHKTTRKPFPVQDKVAQFEPKCLVQFDPKYPPINQLTN